MKKYNKIIRSNHMEIYISVFVIDKIFQNKKLNTSTFNPGKKLSKNIHPAIEI